MSFLDNPDQKTGTTIVLARFVDEGARLELALQCLDDVSWIAVSHVWGDKRWQKIKCLDHEIQISDKKARFVDDRLFDLIGNTWFWLDTITVDQCDQSAVVGILKHIPEIYGRAIRTLAVKENDGIYPCCAEACDPARIALADATAEFDHWVAHASSHYNMGFSLEEAYLTRLWTYQEISLSHTVQFALCDAEDPAYLRRSNPTPFYSLFAMHYSAILRLEIVFRGSEATHILGQGYSAFRHAYICNGTISRGVRSVKEQQKHSEQTLPDLALTHISSLRRATKPQDYIFAIMTQFSWYLAPEALNSMTFATVFVDLAKQARNAGQGFVPIFTTTLLRADVDESDVDVWAPSNDQPEPQCLGDFAKLLGDDNNAATNDWHMVSVAELLNASNASTYDRILLQDWLACATCIRSLAGTCSEHCHHTWGTCVYGTNAGLPSLPKSSLVALDDTMDEAMVLSSAPDQWPYNWSSGALDKSILAMDSEDFADRIAGLNARRKILGLIDWRKDLWATEYLSGELIKEEISFPGLEPIELDAAKIALRVLKGLFEMVFRPVSTSTLSEADAESYLQVFATALCSVGVRAIMIQMAVMLSCHIPLCCFAFVEQRFVTVEVALKNGPKTMGLLSKSYKHLTVELDKNQRRNVAVVARLSNAGTRHRGIRLLDPVSGRICGLLVDFNPDLSKATITTASQREALNKLYGELVQHDADLRQTTIRCVPMRDVSAFCAGDEVQSLPFTIAFEEGEDGHCRDAGNAPGDLDIASEI